MPRRAGFTLIELLIALVILVIVATGVARFSSNFSRAMANSAIRVVAAGIATDRLERVRADSRYLSLESLYAMGAGADTTGFQGYPRMRRVTEVVRDQSGSPPRDQTVVTIRVMDPAMRDTVSLTVVVARP